MKNDLTPRIPLSYRPFHTILSKSWPARQKPLTSNTLRIFTALQKTIHIRRIRPEIWTGRSKGLNPFGLRTIGAGGPGASPGRLAATRGRSHGLPTGTARRSSTPRRRTEDAPNRDLEPRIDRNRRRGVAARAGAERPLPKPMAWAAPGAAGPRRPALGLAAVPRGPAARSATGADPTGRARSGLPAGAGR